MNLSIDDVNDIIENFNIKSDNVLKSYITNIMLSRNDNDYNNIVKAYMDTLIRYNKEQADLAIYKYVTEGDCYYFTNEKVVGI